MKKISRYIFLIGALVLFVGLSPRFLALDKAQETITEQLSKKLGSQVTVQNMQWAWLPLPHLSFTDTKFSNEYSVFSVPEMRIYPNWGIIFNQEVILGSIYLENPDIYIDKNAFQAEKSSKLIIPEISVYINNGTLKVEASENLKEILLEDTHIFSNIDGMLKMERQKAELDLQLSSPFSRSIALQGNFNNNNKNYNLFLDFQDIKLHNSIDAFFKGLLVPVKSTARLAGNISGTGLQKIEANLHGTIPAFIVKQKDREILLTPGFADFTFLKSGPLLRLTVKDLEMKEPRFNLSGLIERKLSTDNNDLELQATGAEPIWTLDLAGNDLDLTEIRHKILTLWENNEVAKNVCNVVLGGEARTAAYRFSGQTAEFENLDAMVIEADVLEAAIHVPGAELDLTKANGPILIEESILTGHNLRAQLGNSYGSKAELLLDLAEDGNAFTLNIDIDADLEALPPVLEQLVDHNGFLEELSKFKEVSGRAKGKLRLGDTLDNIITRVDIRNMKLATRYTPIPQTIYIDKGVLHVGPEDVNWQKVKGRVGLQEILNTNGNVSWKTGDTLLNITEMQGQLDGESLYAMLEQTGVMPGKVKSSLSSLRGNIDVTQGSLTGHAQEPETWGYQLAVQAKGAAFTSPLLPGPVTVNTLSAALNDKAINIQQAEVNFLDQPLSLKGTLYHQELGNWNGMVEFNGPVQAKLTDWVSSKGWVPEKLRPRTPAILENMSVSFQGETIAVSGKILNGLTGTRMPMVKIDLINTPEYLRINELSFFAPGEQGSLALEFRHLPPKGISLSWQGIVSADTIDALFLHNAFTGGTFNGAFFEISYFTDQPEKTRFQGLLKAENLLLKGSSEEEPVILKNVLMNGIGKQLRISALKFDIGTEKMTGFGHLAVGQEGLQLDIDFTSSFISKKSLNDLAQGLKETQRTFFLDQGDELDITKYWDITGRIGFDFDSFSTSRNTTTLDTGTQLVHYTLYDMHGELQLVPDGLTRTEIFSSKLCGLNYKSTWFSNDDLGQHFELTTGSNTSLRLENILPCLGVAQDLIEGEFSLQANLRKESGEWYSGNVHLTSTKGKILRLQLLSRIFMIVNITDIFVTQPGSTGKKGFPFSQLDIDTHINENYLFFDRAMLHGEGLNLFLQGDVHLTDYDSDMTLLIAPFKTFDTLVSIVPVIGKPLMSEYNSLLAIPVAIKGPLADPFITPLHPEAVSGALFNVVKGTLKLPYNILKPKKEDKEPDETNTEKEN
jgi:hypothetical protein